MAYRRTSATRLPNTNIAAEIKVAAITTGLSLLRTESNTRGPRPGQPITISITRDALKNAPMESPKIEIKGFAAMGSA